MKEGARLLLASAGAALLLYTGALLEKEHQVVEKTSETAAWLTYQPRRIVSHLLWGAGDAVNPGPWRWN